MRLRIINNAIIVETPIKNTMKLLERREEDEVEREEEWPGRRMIVGEWIGWVRLNL